VDMELLDRLIVSSPAALRAGLAHNWPALPPAPFIPVAHRIELLALSLSLSLPHRRVVGPALNAKVPALNLFFPGAERFLQTAVYTNSALLQHSNGCFYGEFVQNYAVKWEWTRHSLRIKGGNERSFSFIL
jgi:hypothetical protein